MDGAETACGSTLGRRLALYISQTAKFLEVLLFEHLFLAGGNAGGEPGGDLDELATQARRDFGMASNDIFELARIGLDVVKLVRGVASQHLARRALGDSSDIDRLDLGEVEKAPATICRPYTRPLGTAERSGKGREVLIDPYRATFQSVS